jgi:hypothetical protein
VPHSERDSDWDSDQVTVAVTARACYAMGMRRGTIKIDVELLGYVRCRAERNSRSYAAELDTIVQEARGSDPSRGQAIMGVGTPTGKSSGQRRDSDGTAVTEGLDTKLVSYLKGRAKRNFRSFVGELNALVQEAMAGDQAVTAGNRRSPPVTAGDQTGDYGSPTVTASDHGTRPEPVDFTSPLPDWQAKQVKIGSCGYLGVEKRGNKFGAYQWQDGSKRRIGSYDTAEAAARARDDYVRKLQTEFSGDAVYNFPRPDEHGVPVPVSGDSHFPAAYRDVTSDPDPVQARLEAERARIDAELAKLTQGTQGDAKLNAESVLGPVEGMIGVERASHGRFEAVRWYDGDRTSLGFYPTAEAAGRFRDDYVRRLTGEYSGDQQYNYPSEGEIGVQPPPNLT